MEATADNLLNQVSDVILKKLDKQKFDPKFLKKFMDGVLEKIPQVSTSSPKEGPSSNATGLVKDIKKAYNELVKTDATFKNNLKTFLLNVFPKALTQSPADVNTPPLEVVTKEDGTESIKTEEKQDTDTGSEIQLKRELDTKQNTDNSEQESGRKKLIKTKQEPQPVIIAGFSEKSLKFFGDKLPKLLKSLIPKTIETKKDEKGIGLLGSGLMLLLGGLAALVGAFMTQGPAKGTLELIGKVGLKGGLILLAKKLFGATLKTALKRIPIIGTLLSYGFAIQRFNNGDTIGGIIDLVSGTVQLLDLVAPGLGTVLSLGVDILQAVLDAKAGGSSAEASAKKGSILLDWAKGLGSLLWKGLKYIPVLGPLFDAVDSYQKGDWSGFTLNLLRSVGQMSGVFYIIDLFDSLTGGNLKDMAKEGISSMGNWISDMSSWLYESAKSWPIIGRLIKIGEAIGQGNWAEAITHFTRILPGVGWLLDWIGLTEEKQTQAYEQTGNILTDLWDWMKNTMWEKVTGFVSGLIDGVKDWWNNLSWDPRSWVGMAPEQSDIAPKSKGTVTINGKQMSMDEYEQYIAQNKKPTPMAEGGIVTQPTKALIGEAGPEAVMPLEKVFGSDGIGLNNNALDKIVANTGDTNAALKTLSEALFKLVTVFDKKLTSTNNSRTIINTGGNDEDPTPASAVVASNQDPIRRIRMQFA